MDERPVFDTISQRGIDVRRRLELEHYLFRWRTRLDLTPHYAGGGHSVLLLRTAELVPWEREMSKRGLVAAHHDRWPLEPIVDRVTQPATYSFISCNLREASARTGLSPTTLRQAIADGYLTAHWAGEKGGRIVVRAQDLDEWVRSLPTESPRERGWASY